MPLRGSLKTISLSSVLQLLHTEKLTGMLRVTDSNVEYQITILKGDIIYATESKKGSRLGILLKQEGLLTEEQIQKCLIIAKKKKMALGKILVLEGIITSEILKKYIYKQVEEILFNLFRWENGEFDFKETTLNLKWLVVFKLNILKLILDASRKIDTMSVLAKRIPSDLIIFKISEKTKLDKEKKLNADEQTILSLIDGKLNVKELIDKSEFGHFVMYKILYSFVSTGLIKEHVTKKTN